MIKTLFAILLIATTLPSCTREKQKTQVKAVKPAFVYAHESSGNSWIESQKFAEISLEFMPFSKVASTYYNIKTFKDAKNTIGQLAEVGHDIIFCHGPSFNSAMLEVAKSYPRRVFMGYEVASNEQNVGSYWIKIFQAKFLAGMIAAGVSSNGKIGYVSDMPTSSNYRQVNAFTLGARLINPDAVVLHIWTNRGDDEVTEKAATKMLIDSAVDVLTLGLNTSTPVRYSASKGIYTIGHNIAMKKILPKNHLADIVLKWDKIFAKTIEEVAQGSWNNRKKWFGFDEDALDLINLSPKIPDDIRLRVFSVKNSLKENSMKVFAGQINSTDGRIIVQEGFYLLDEALLRMNWFVEGVEKVQLPEE